MRPKHSGQPKASAERVVKDIRRATRRHFSAEDKIRIVLDGLRGEDSIAELCRKEGIAQSLYYTWSKGIHGSWQAQACGRHCTCCHQRRCAGPAAKDSERLLNPMYAGRPRRINRLADTARK